MGDTDPLLRDIERYLSDSGMSATAFGLAAVNDPALIYDLRNGREPRRATRCRIREFLAAETAS
jgi:hypothetical protein